jgi:2-polyprenyl-6-methoxyphenol hydroxylase-like FAD-dependent oxidoreductase
VYWWTAHNAAEGELVEPARRKAHLLARFASWPFGLEQAISSTPSEAILQNDLVDRAPAKAYARGPVVLTGDAAHPTTPNLGQGANMAIDDAIVLARALRDETSIALACARYERERLPPTRQIVERSWSFGQMCRWQSPLAVSLRELMLRITPERMLRNLLRSQILESVGAL